MFYEKNTGRLVPCFVHSQPGTKAFARKPASVREMIGVRNLFNKMQFSRQLELVLGSVGVGVVGPLVGRRRAQKIEGKGSGGEAK
eukprot:COSAG05_NODE_1200_length_5550_cov_39.606494_2_plen_85_part_00